MLSIGILFDFLIDFTEELKIVICYAEFVKPSIFLSDIGLTEGKFLLVR
jgi:hypothetical protein